MKDKNFISFKQINRFFRKVFQNKVVI